MKRTALVNGLVSVVALFLMVLAGLAAEKKANKDGVITRKEMAAEAGHRFAQANANKDGKLSEDEFDEYCEVEFARWDVDKDGRLTLDEFLLARVPVKHIKTEPKAACPAPAKAEEKK